MAIQRTPQPAPPKKSGMGCFGCGCLIVILLFLLVGGILAGGAYTSVKALGKVSSAQPLAVPPYTPKDGDLAGAQKKLAQFQSDLNANRPAHLALTSDDLNALINQAPPIQQMKANVQVTMQGDQMHLQAEAPSNAVPIVNLGVKDRYFNIDAVIGVHLNSVRELEITFTKVQVGDFDYSQDLLKQMQEGISQTANQKLQQDPNASKLLSSAQTFGIKDGQFVIDTK